MISRDTVQKIIILFLFVVLAAVLCVPLKIIINSSGAYKPGHDIDPGDSSAFHKTGSYAIDSNTVLNSIESGQNGVFLPATTPFGKVTESDGSLWTQSDYEKIVRVFFDFAWKETLSSDWEIHKMNFETTCREDPVGFEYASFVFYQQIFRQGELRYNARAIEILQEYGQVIWGGDSTFFRPILGANLTDVDKIKVSADDVLSIVEKNGGKEIRQSVQNNCEIHLYFEKNWEVDYVGSNGLPLMEYTVDSISGKIIKSQD